jgi:hypothetical protein
MFATAALGTKYETRHTSLFHKKIGFTQSLLSSSNNNIFNKGFSNISDCSSILMHSKRSPIKNWRHLGILSVCSMTTRSAEQSVVGRWVRRVRQCKKSAKYGYSVTSGLQGEVPNASAGSWFHSLSYLQRSIYRCLFFVSWLYFTIVIIPVQVAWSL